MLDGFIDTGSGGGIGWALVDDITHAEIDVRKFEPPIDSSDMDPMRWAEIVSIISNSYNDYDGFYDT